MKTCTKCGKINPVEEFFRDKRSKDGRESSCKACTSKRLKKWYLDNQDEARLVRRDYYHATKDPEKIKERNIKRRYKLDMASYKEMLSNGCAVCGSFEKLCIDHDHLCCSGKETCGMCIRGVLCAKHNRADGMFDTIEQIEKYLAYRKGFVIING